MFKKNVSILTSRPISGKDVKTLKHKVEISFPDLSKEDVDQLFPSKVEVQMLKLKNKATAYTCGSADPLFFDPEGRGDLLVPTVYTLWRFPHILDKLVTYSEVSPKVLGGADLFLQGLIVQDGGLGDFSAGDLRAVAIPGNPYPFAVGTMEVGSTDVAKTGLKGKGLKLLHHFPDQLWGLGEKSTPDPSFTPTRIFPQQECLPVIESSAAAGSAADGVAAMAISGPAQQDAAPDSSTAEQPPVAAAPADGSQDASAAKPAGAAACNDPDRLIEECLLGGLQSVDDSELPMLTSDFYSKHMLRLKPDGANVDIKKSSYKKLSKLLSTFEKKGLLTQKVIHKQDRLASVNRSHELYTSFAPRDRGVDESLPDQATASKSAPAASAGKISVSYSYRVPSSLRPIWGPAADADRDALYSREQVEEALLGYAQREGLAAAGADTLKLDKLLVGHLFNKKEPQQEGDEHAMEDTFKRLLSKLQMFHTISRSTPEGVVEVVKKGSVKNIAVSMEDRMGGRKHLTHLSHVESFGLNPDELGAEMQRRFQTSCSVTKLPGKTETGKEIALQGNLIKELPKFLMEAYGIDAQYIDIKAKGG